MGFQLRCGKFINDAIDDMHSLQSDKQTNSIQQPREQPEEEQEAGKEYCKAAWQRKLVTGPEKDREPGSGRGGEKRRDPTAAAGAWCGWYSDRTRDSGSVAHWRCVAREFCAVIRQCSLGMRQWFNRRNNESDWFPYCRLFCFYHLETDLSEPD